MARRDYVVEGAILECTLGTTPGEMIVTSQQKVKIGGKLKATCEDKIPKPPFFGSCTCSSPNPPCSPVFKEWQQTSKGSTMGDKTFLMANSKVPCEKGGLVTIKDVGQKLVGSGKKESELDEKYAELKGEIIFANGYFSSSLGGVMNALFDNDTDGHESLRYRGLNADENDKTNPQDLQLSRENEETDNMTCDEIEADRIDKAFTVHYPTIEFEDAQLNFPMTMSPLVPFLPNIDVKIPRIKDGSKSIDIPVEAKPISLLTQKETKELFWGYWNLFSNKFMGSQTYADHFNAGSNQHFLNGSHGLGSNAAHRLDHGIAQGYHWANYQWGIISKKEVDETKEKVTYIESYSPAYKPLTIVMHSQGNAPGVGFALGAMKYAKELGWDEIPLNLIFLGVHQPQNLWEEEYEKFIETKVKYYGVDKDFWDGAALSPFLKKDKRVHAKFSNALSELFSPEYHKLRNKRGIYEHLQAISDFGALKERSVQFTFANDRGDLVIRDGDIPEIDSACNPKRDTSTFSLELYSHNVDIPEYYTGEQGKEVISLENGQLVIPPYAAIPRIEVEINEKTGEEELKEWGDYRSIAMDWGNAFATYKKLLKEDHFTWKDLFAPYLAGRKLNLSLWHKRMLYHYGRIQHADLYAHFSPVGLLLNDKILKTKDFEDGLGNENIWERIKKVGERKFYRVDDGSEKTPEQKRVKEKDDIEGKLKNRVIKTNIADTAYINNVIKAYVEKDADAVKRIYEEPVFTDREQGKINNLIKKFGHTEKSLRREGHTDEEVELLKKNQITRDNTPVTKTKQFLKK
ncbi:protein of unknown function [Pricia antarctica]|uniref:DUF4280 domain-containing protein n=1 Tax=Pricia antarctica TaxID=641691 RepID=A0A1G7DGN7_9FLAO|nr:DUF4280 domain-containing protein [Pricia antarctica]SDE50190.1 protein of unknown function [Pricia antarctica]